MKQMVYRGLVVTITDAAKIMNVSYATARRMVKEGKVKTTKNRRVLITSLQPYTDPDTYADVLRDYQARQVTGQHCRSVQEEINRLELLLGGGRGTLQTPAEAVPQPVPGTAGGDIPLTN